MTPSSRPPLRLWPNGSPVSRRSPSATRSGPSTRRPTSRSARASGKPPSARPNASVRPTSSRPSAPTWRSEPRPTKTLERPGGSGVSPEGESSFSQDRPRTIGATMSEPSTEYFRVRPNGPLEGEIKVSGATKNSGLKQLAAAILAPGVSVFHNMPPVLDATVMIEVMRALGAAVEWTGPETLQVDTSGDLLPEAPYELVSRMRASVNVLGPLLGRCGSARVALPGGDAIGSRRLDMHLRGLEAMGAEARIDHGFIEARATVLRGARIVLEFPSVGATENLMTAAVLAKGRTLIDNAAREPEINALSTYLTHLGAQN